MRTFLASVTACAVALTVLPVRADSVARDVQWRIRREAVEHSQILKTLHVLTDVYGPRLTGSPNLKAAGEWAIGQLEAWGLRNGALEPWDWGHPGWVNERFSAHLVSPVTDALVGEVLAWTPSTAGAVTAPVVQIEPPDDASGEELTAYLDSVAERVRGCIVLVGPRETVGVRFSPAGKRLDDSEARARFAAASPSPAPRRQPPAEEAERLSSRRRAELIDRFLIAHGAVARLNDAGREHGQIRAFANRTYDVSGAVPTAILRNEDYGRIARLLDDGRTVEMELHITNRIVPEGRTAYNAVAEIPGSDRADEVVMLGAHLDSWHAATGATDNGIGSAVVMEAARILAALDVQPRRTIRVALWSGEEQGLLGSRAYVRKHFGTAEAPTAAHETFSGYVNIDTGTGRVRGLTVFGPDEAAEVLRDIVAPMADLGVAGVIATSSRRTGGTDHTAFNAAGLPGIGTALDPIEYRSHTWHTNLDTYERIIEADVQQAAIVIATVVYHLAMRDERLPRFGKGEMPAPASSPDDRPDPARPSPTAG